jgi:hypothetical protein
MANINSAKFQAFLLTFGGCSNIANLNTQTETTVLKLIFRQTLKCEQMYTDRS